MCELYFAPGRIPYISVLIRTMKAGQAGETLTPLSWGCLREKAAEVEDLAERPPGQRTYAGAPLEGMGRGTGREQEEKGEDKPQGNGWGGEVVESLNRRG